MTATQLLAEILLRCGEGYENYTDRAKAAFNATVHDLISNYQTRLDALTGLIYTGEYTFPADTSSIPVQTLIEDAGYNVGILRYMDYTPPTGGVFMPDNTPLEYASPSQQKAMKLRSGLSHTPAATIYYGLSTGDDGVQKINLLGNTEFEENGVLLYTVIGWNDAAIDTGSLEVSAMFSPVALENLISVSAEKLRREIAL